MVLTLTVNHNSDFCRPEAKFGNEESSLSLITADMDRQGKVAAIPITRRICFSSVKTLEMTALPGFPLARPSMAEKYESAPDRLSVRKKTNADMTTSTRYKCRSGRQKCCRTRSRPIRSRDRKSPCTAPQRMKFHPAPCHRP